MTIAEKIAAAPNPIANAARQCVSSMSAPDYVRTYTFKDGSVLTFDKFGNCVASMANGT